MEVLQVVHVVLRRKVLEEILNLDKKFRPVTFKSKDHIPLPTGSKQKKLTFKQEEEEIHIAFRDCSFECLEEQLHGDFSDITTDNLEDDQSPSIDDIMKYSFDPSQSKSATIRSIQRKSARTCFTITRKRKAFGLNKKSKKPKFSRSKAHVNVSEQDVKSESKPLITNDRCTKDDTEIENLPDKENNTQDIDSTENAVITEDASWNDNTTKGPETEMTEANISSEEDSAEKKENIKRLGPARQAKAKVEISKCNEVPRIKCRFCEKQLTRDVMLQHIVLHKQVPAIERKEFKDYIKQEAVKLPCDDCGMVFSTKSSLKMHISRFHSENSDKKIKERKIQCRICKSWQISHYACYRHVREYHKDHTDCKPFKDYLLQFLKGTCDICGKTCNILPNHKKNICNAEQRIPCETCGVMLKRYTMRQHVKQFHLNPPKPIKCPECDKTLANPSYLKRHIEAMHMGVKTINCDICGKSFYNASQMRSHREYHKTDKPHLCNYCGKSFKVKTELAQHVKIIHEHKNEFSHYCPICAKGFHGAKNMKTHFYSVHHRIHRFECFRCNMKYRSNKALKDHLPSCPKTNSDAVATEKENQMKDMLKKVNEYLKKSDTSKKPDIKTLPETNNASPEKTSKRKQKQNRKDTEKAKQNKTDEHQVIGHRPIPIAIKPPKFLNAPGIDFPYLSSGYNEISAPVVSGRDVPSVHELSHALRESASQTLQNAQQVPHQVVQALGSVPSMTKPTISNASHIISNTNSNALQLGQINTIHDAASRSHGNNFNQWFDNTNQLQPMQPAEIQEFLTSESITTYVLDNNQFVKIGQTNNINNQGQSQNNMGSHGDEASQSQGHITDPGQVINQGQISNQGHVTDRNRMITQGQINNQGQGQTSDESQNQSNGGMTNRVQNNLISQNQGNQLHENQINLYNHTHPLLSD